MLFRSHSKMELSIFESHSIIGSKSLLQTQSNTLSKIPSDCIGIIGNLPSAYSCFFSSFSFLSEPPRF